MDKYHWQVPGNANIFDSKLSEWHNSLISERSIGVLQFINEKERITKSHFEEQIWDFLIAKYHHVKNNSTIAHFYRPLEFAGLIRNIDGMLSLSIDGRQFLKNVEEKQYDKAIDFYILQLMKVRYPNTATPSVKLYLFPFRIMFKLFIDYESIPIDYFTGRINYISNIEDINTLNLSSSSAYKKGLHGGEEKNKWKSWIISYLVKWGILDYSRDKKNIFISIYKYDFIKSIVGNMKYEDMFFYNEVDEIEKKNAIKINQKRDYRLIKKVIENNKQKCFLNESHITFKSDLLDNYMEGHHIIPMSLQDSYEENLDSIDNLIPLCPNCHRAIHLANNETKIDLLKQIVEKNTKLKNINNTSLDDLIEIYCK